MFDFEKDKNTWYFILFIIIVVFVIFYLDRREHFDVPTGDYPFINNENKCKGTIPKTDLSMALKTGDNDSVNTFKNNLCTNAGGTFASTQTGNSLTIKCNKANRYVSLNNKCVDLNNGGKVNNIAYTTYKDYVCSNGANRETIKVKYDDKNVLECTKYGGITIIDPPNPARPNDKPKMTCSKYLKSQYSETDKNCIKPKWIK